MATPQTVILERDAVFTDELCTEPLEAGWATEALFFVRALELSGTWTGHVQLSSDGIDWVDAPQCPEVLVEGVGIVPVPVAHFGVWLRIRLAPAQGAGPLKARVTLVLK